MRQKTGACELELALRYLIYGSEQQGKRRTLRSGIGRGRATLSCARSRRHVSAFACNPCLHSTRLWEMDKDAKDVVTGK